MNILINFWYYSKNEAVDTIILTGLLIIATLYLKYPLQYFGYIIK